MQSETGGSMSLCCSQLCRPMFILLSSSWVFFILSFILHWSHYVLIHIALLLYLSIFIYFLSFYFFFQWNKTRNLAKCWKNSAKIDRSLRLVVEITVIPMRWKKMSLDRASGCNLLQSSFRFRSPWLTITQISAGQRFLALWNWKLHEANRILSFKKLFDIRNNFFL